MVFALSADVPVDASETEGGGAFAIGAASAERAIDCAAASALANRTMSIAPNDSTRGVMPATFTSYHSGAFHAPPRSP